MNEGQDTGIDLRDPDIPGDTPAPPGAEVDLTDRLRFAADSLAADFGEEISFDHAEALVLRSAEGLLAAASVTDFVPILAERRARLAVRSGAHAGPPPVAAPAPAPPAPAPPAPAPPAPAPPAGPDPGQTDVAPLLAVPERELTRLRNDVQRLHMRVAEWRADLRRASGPAT